MNKIAIIASDFHKDLIEKMADDAKKTANENDMEITDVYWVAGCYETPLIIKKVLDKKENDALIVLGYIEKGETKHGEQMGFVVSRIIKELELEYGVPIGMGIIGPGATKEQAEKRIHFAGKSVLAVKRMLDLLDQI